MRGFFVCTSNEISPGDFRLPELIDILGSEEENYFFFAAFFLTAFFAAFLTAFFAFLAAIVIS